MSNDAGRSVRDEDGVALVAVLFAALIVGGLAALMLTAATFETRSTAAARDEEAAIHAADAGADLVFGRVLDDPDYSTGHVWSGAVRPTPAQERAWVLAQPLSDHARVDTGDGAGYGIGPVTVGDTTVVYGVGITGREAAPRSRRVVRTEIVRSGGGIGDAAILVGGDLEFVGGISWIDGGVHTNANLTLLKSQGGGITVTSTMTASGTWQQGTTGSPITVVGSGSGKPVGGIPQRTIPDVSARQIHEQYAAATASWYDLCPYTVNGKDRGQVRRGAATPCSGQVLASLPGDWDAWCGWRYQNRTWRKEWPTSAADDAGVFYAHHRNIELLSLNWDASARATYLAAADPSDTGSGSGARSGNVNYHGSSPVRHFPGVTPWAILADRDVYTASGGGGRIADGLIYAREQVEFYGTLGHNQSTPMTGSIIAGDFSDSPGSPISTSRFHGSVYVRSVPAYDLGGDSGVQVYSWAEL